MRRNTEFPWIKSYPPGIHWDAELPTAPVPQLLDDAAAKWPDHAAIDFMGRRITYRELQDLINLAAKGFQKLGVKPGIHVGLYLPNTPHYVISFFGVPDTYRGESPKAFIVLKPGAPPFTLDDLKNFLKRRLGKHEMVQSMDIRDQLPRTPVGKLSKKELYDEEERKRNIA